MESPRRPEKGVVTLEFLMLFPFIVAMLYATAVYSIVFFNYYRMQNAVDRAVDAGLDIDRMSYSSCSETNGGADSEGNDSEPCLTEAVKTRAQSALQQMASALPLKDFDTMKCDFPSEGEMEMLTCTLSYSAVRSIAPLFSFGVLGDFPPLPDSMETQAQVAF